MVGIGFDNTHIVLVCPYSNLIYPKIESVILFSQKEQILSFKAWILTLLLGSPSIVVTKSFEKRFEQKLLFLKVIAITITIIC